LSEQVATNAQPHAIVYAGELLSFEHLIVDLSKRFNGLDSTQVFCEIEAAEKLVCEALGFDRIALALWDDNAKEFLVTHSWASSALEAGCGFKSPYRPWLAAKLLRGEEVRITCASDLPLEASKSKETIELLGTKSTLVFPLKAGRQVVGGLAFGTFGVDCELPEPVVDRLRVIADLFSNILARKLSEEALLESRERIRLAVESAELGFWTWNLRGDDLWASERTFSLIGLPRSDWLSYDHFLDAVHPEDRATVHGSMGAATLVPKEFCTDFRVVYPNGTVRWMNCRGRSFADAVGKSSHMQGFIFDITNRKIAHDRSPISEDLSTDLPEANREIESFKEQNKNIYLREEIKVERNHQEVVGQSKAIRRVLMNVEQVARTSSTVLLLGETGTGKELIARAIHRNSNRKDRLMVIVNCAALPATLVENELFGREKGAYTGALTREIGRFEMAHESTIFLDEIGELPLELQAKLLRVLQEGEFERLGSSRTIHVDVRLIVATSRNLEAAVRDGKFREDLYYRLNVFPIHIPPLRERREDIPMLTWHFLRDLGGRMGRDIQTVKASTMNSFECYRWPGNVRELRNVIERHLITYKGPVFEAELPPMVRAFGSAEDTAEEVERNHIHRVLERTGWRIRGQGGAAQKLDLKPTTLESRMRKLGIFRH
jgi:formate hydrogenlyase transcriptional activator